MNSREIRTRFLDFFVKNGHEKVASSSLIPAQDPTILFANAGMNQFKDLFLGYEKRSYVRATSAQKCVRAGGKHNDLDNVGFTKRHLTFFEMLGNFSFGDYFKKEAISYAWKFLTEEIKLDKNELHVSVFETDDESYDIWHKEVGVPVDRVHRLGAEHNFWQMGDVGPCGPCTEIYIDRGAAYGHSDNELCGPGCDCDRFLEIWNLVFMQFDRQHNGDLKPLKQTGVDTGMGLERLCSVVQNKDSVFNTDLFMPIIEKIQELTGIAYEQQNAEIKAAFHVLADHARSTSFIIADGGTPTNEGRGYVLRKIIRRAALFVQKLTDKNIFPEISRVVVSTMSDAYPELRTQEQLIYNTLNSEIEKFSVNLIRGKNILERYFEDSKATHIISGNQAFKLYDTYGFPVEIVVAAARERGYTVDTQEFEAEMSRQQEQSGKKVADLLSHMDLDYTTEFTGYTELETISEIIALVVNGQQVDVAQPGQEVYVIAHKSPFFIVGGGQVPDQGTLTINNVTMSLNEVRYINTAIAPQVTAQTVIRVGDSVTACVDKTWRTNAMKNHTGTHLLQAALIELFGKQIQQSGSLVHPDYLRFDFTYHTQLTADDIKKVEDIVNEKIREDIPVVIENCNLKEAQQRGALAFFGEKYKPESVRVVQVGDFSVELCGGTHVPRTGVIGTFKIVESAALSAGHRRIVAVTGPRAIELFQETFNVVKTVSQDYKVKREEVLDQVCKQKELCKQLQHDLKQLRSQLVMAQIPVLEKQIDSAGSVPYLFAQVNHATVEDLRTVTSSLMQKHPGFYCVITLVDNKPLFYSAVSSEYTTVVDMKSFAAFLKDQCGLRGGGSKNSIQGGGEAYDALCDQKIKQWMSSVK